MRSCRSVWLLCIMAVTLAGCSIQSNAVDVSVRSHNNAVSPQDSQRIHVNGGRVALEDVRSRVQSLAHGCSIPINLRVGLKCDPTLLGALIQELLAVEPRPVLQIDQSQG